MILNALYDCYDLLENDGESEIAPPGYSRAMCAFAIILSKEGDFKNVIDLKEGNKGEYFIVPEQAGRSANILPYFMCDKSKYLLGKEFEKKQKALVDFQLHHEASLELHKEILEGVNDDGAKAMLMFLERVASQGITQIIEEENPCWQGGLIVFRLQEKSGYLHERSAIIDAWDAFYEKEKRSTDDTAKKGQCLISGKLNSRIARTHTQIKGVRDANPTGAAIVSFNTSQPSFSSYGKEQSYNAPVSEEAMFKYTTALNYLLSHSQNRIVIGDTTVVFWTKKTMSGQEIDLISCLLNGLPSSDPEEDTNPVSREEKNLYVEEILRNVLLKVKAGVEINKDVSNEIDLNTETYLLGLSPNNARIVIRFWYKNTLAEFVEKMGQHYADMEVVMPPNAIQLVTVRDILKSAAVLGDFKNIPFSLEAGLINAILSGTPYPQGVYNAILMRIRNEAGEKEKEKEKDYSPYKDRIRVGFLKAHLKRYYRKTKQTEKEEELTVSLNLESKDSAYNLGRLFAVLEKLQSDANNGNTTIRARYFSGASTTPRIVFPTLLNLAQHHIAKVEYNIYYDKEIGSILEQIDDGFPANLTLEEQGRFMLGYYHQRQYSFRKKEEK